MTLEGTALELLLVEVSPVGSREDSTVGAAEELDGTDVDVDVAVVMLAAVEVVVAAGSELPQPVISTAAAVAVARRADLDA